MVRKQKEKGHIQTLAFIGLVFLMVGFVTILIWENENRNGDCGDGGFEESKSLAIKPCVAHSPIHINGNADFASQATNEHWSGDGSQGNPYIIEGYDINGNGSNYCIWIENTNVYFVIRNCYVHGATNSETFPYGSGIALNNTRNGIVTNNNANGNFYGIYLYSSIYNNIAYNHANDNSYGIYMYSSSNNTITNNNARSNSCEGLYLGSSTSNTITNNNISSNSDDGIFLWFSNSNTIANNNVCGNSDNGISLWHSSENSIKDNNVSGNLDDGIHLEYSTYNTMTDNEITWNSDKGISLWRSSKNTITNNRICNNQNYGVYITQSSAENAIHHNSFIGNNAATKGLVGRCQAYDNVGSNYWYVVSTKEGNSWSNWDGNGWGTASAYPIDGGMASDWYPLIEVKMKLEKNVIEGKKDAKVLATITVKANGIGVSNLPVTVRFDTSGLSATSATTDHDGRADVTITLTEEFTEDTFVEVTPIVADTARSNAAQYLVVKGVTSTSGCGSAALITAITLAAGILAYSREKER